MLTFRSAVAHCLVLFSLIDFLTFPNAINCPTFLGDLIDHSFSSLLLSPPSLQSFHSLIHSDRHWTLPDLRAHGDGGERVGNAPVNKRSSTRVAFSALS